jgi:two-component system phosphate regulon sensor histidine kinase PhoR
MAVSAEHHTGTKKNAGWLRLLISITLLGITGFQLYWLRDNYIREKKSLTLKTDDAFRKTIMQLQAKKLNLDSFSWNKSDKGEVKVFVASGDENTKVKLPPNGEMITTINLLRDKLKDTMARSQKMVISLNQTAVSVHGDSAKLQRQIHQPVRGHDIFSVLYGVDSLQEPLRTGEIDSAYKTALQQKNIRIPFSVIKTDSCSPGKELQPNEVTVGFVNPVVYKMKPGNTFPYLLKQISPAILFSLLLLGITVFSFVMLYRNMLKQRRLAEAKNEFISNITHELKTPIATVGVAIEALKNFNAMQDPQRTKEYLDISSNELQRLSLLVDKVLKLSMFENQGIELRYELLNLDELVREVEGSLKLQAEKHQATITVSTEGDTNLSGDRLHLQSVVFNLLDNALKYGKDKPVINVSVIGSEESVTLKVSDNGIGIPREYKDKVFEKFFRVPHGDTHNAKGYGLGLSYAAQVVKKHNGTIEVESEPGKGSVFLITLPKQKA